MKILYQIADEKEVWNNYMCRLRFLNENKEVIYSRNVFAHKIIHGQINSYIYSIKEKHSIILYEYLRPRVADLTLICFAEKIVYRAKAEDEIFALIFGLSDLDKLNYIKRTFSQERFVIEKIRLPLFRFWKTKKLW